MLLFTTLVLFSIRASKAEPPHNYYHNFNQGRGKPFVRQWSPYKSASPDNFNFQELAYQAPSKPPELPVQSNTPQYSTPWLPIGSAIDQHSSGYRSETPRFPDYHVSPPLRHSPPPVQHNPPHLQHTPPPVQHIQSSVQHTQPQVQHNQPPVQHTQPPVQHNQPPVQHSPPPVQHNQPPVQHNQPPVQHNQPPVQHNQPPVQHNQPPVQHTGTQLLAQHTSPPGPSNQLFNRYPTQAPYDPNVQKHYPFGGPQLETPHRQSPGFNQYQRESNVQHLPSSYDVPLYAPMYEPGPNEDYSQAIDWASFADAFGPPESSPQPQRPPNHRYKIVFIKTPRIPGFYPPTTPPPPQDQEKTLIYVLVNRPEYDSATTPAPPPSTTPSKPEVYFIQYKTKANQSQTQTGSTVENGYNGGDPGHLYEGQDMNQHRYGSTFSKPVDGNSL